MSPWWEVAAMRKLLSASFCRLIKNKVFWLELIFTLAFSLYICFVNYSPERQAAEYRIHLDDVFFTFYQLLGFLIAAGISLITGSEYSDGTIRNKLVVGHTRVNLYFSNLLASGAVSVLIVLIHMAVTGTVGYLLFGAFQMQLSQAVFAIACVCLAAFSYTCICTFISMNCSNKAAAAVISLVLMLGLLYAGSSFGSALLEPETTYSGVTITSNGIQYGDMIQNPAYISGARRSVYEFLYDLLPTGQLNQIYSLDFARAARWPWLSVGLSVLMSAAGFAAFRRKNIK